MQPRSHTSRGLFPGGGSQRVGRRPRNGFGFGEPRVILALAGIQSVNQLLQTDHIGAVLGEEHDSHARCDVDGTVAQGEPLRPQLLEQTESDRHG